MKIWRVLLIGVCGFVLAAHAAGADTVRLKNGNVVEGKIIERTDESVKVDIGGAQLTYYSDEIESVDIAAAAVAAAPEVPAEVPAAQAAAEPEAVAPVVAAPVEVQQKVAAPVVEPQAAAPAPADEFDGLGKAELINKFVEIYGVKQNMQMNFDQMTSTLPPEKTEAFRNSVKVDEIIQELLPIYDKHFTADDLRAYIRFYSSPEGKKLVQALPLLMKDSVEVSMKYLDAHLPESLKQDQPESSGK